jgi:predicted phage terminase large subunit-like protein
MSETEEILKYGENDLEWFAKYFLSKQHKNDFATFHKDICQMLFSGESKAVVAAPRHHGKSTICSFDFPVHCGCYGYPRPVLLISNTSTFAEKWLTDVKTEFETNEAILEVFGDLRGDVWRTNELWFKNGAKLFARGRGQQVRGWHYGKVICDDLEDNELVRSDLQMTQFEEWFDRELLYTLDPDSQMLYIGTMVSPNCFLKKLMGHQSWKPYFYQAYKEGIEKEGNELFPARWPHTKLQEFKKHNPYAFAMEMMNLPVPDEDKRIKPEWLQFYNSAPEGLRVFVTIDPSISTRKRADPSAIVVCGIAPNGDIYVLDVYNATNDPHVLVEEIFRINRTYNPFKIGIEVVAFQKMLKIYIEEKAKERGIYLPIEELKTDTRVNKQMRISGLIPYFAEMRVFLKQGQYSLIQQLRDFSPNQLNMHDDAIDALAYQIQLWVKPGYSTAGQKISGEEWMRRQQEKFIKKMLKDDDDDGIIKSGYLGDMALGE